MKKLVFVLAVTVAFSACDHRKGSVLSPSDIVTTGDDVLLTSLFTVDYLGNGRVSIKYHGEPKLSMPQGLQLPLTVTMPDAMGNPATSQNTIQDLVFDDHTCGSSFKRIRVQFASASGSEIWKTSGTYVEFAPCGKQLDVRWGVRLMDGQTYHSANRFTQIESSNINARLVGDRIISDSWP